MPPCAILFGEAISSVSCNQDAVGIPGTPHPSQRGKNAVTSIALPTSSPHTVVAASAAGTLSIIDLDKQEDHLGGCLQGRMFVLSIGAARVSVSPLLKGRAHL